MQELAEEGSAFEANAVMGVEDSNDPNVSEVTTRQVPEDDIPGEYLDDKDEHAACGPSGAWDLSTVGRRLEYERSDRT